MHIEILFFSHHDHSLIYFSVYPSSRNKEQSFTAQNTLVSKMLPSLSSQKQSSFKMSHTTLFGPEPSKDRNWSDSELYKLSSFLVYHRNKFQSQKIRKQAKVFAVLSKYIKTRNPNQCRNYVQKLFCKFTDYRKIIEFFRQSLPSFEQNYAIEVENLNNIIFPLKVASNELLQLTPKHQPSSNLQQPIASMKQEEGDEHKQLKPTDISYCDEALNKTYKHQSHNERHSKDYSSQIWNKSKVNDKSSSSVLDESYFSSHFHHQQAQIQKKWEDCHNLFLQWTSKTGNLLQKYERLQSNQAKFNY